MNLLSEVRFASLLVYAPQGQAEVSRRSRVVCDAIKCGERDVLKLAAQRLQECQDAWVPEFFSSETILVPVPGSSPMKDPASLWVSMDICRELIARQLGKESNALVERRAAVPKSAFSLPHERPKPSHHFQSFHVARSLFVPKRITLIDDVVTKGATLIAAASRLREAFPSCELRVFALMRTMSRTEVDAILSPTTGVITYNSSTDSSRREP